MPFAKVSDLARLALVAAQYRELVGEAIRARRKEMGLTQPQLADRVETYLREHGKREDGNPFDAQNISRWERGKNLATTDNLEAVAHSLETTPGEMLARVHAAQDNATPAKTPDLMRAMNGNVPADAPEWAIHLFHKLDERLDLILDAVNAFAEQEPEQEEPPSEQVSA